jgi:mono/diheme cytochrome c family protein
MPYKGLLTITLLITTLLVAGCGTIATQEPPPAPTREPVTLVPGAVADADGEADTEAVAEVPTATATDIPPTEVPPTATPTEIPPTATATATPTVIPPTATPEAVGDVANGEVLFLNGKDAAPACVTCHLLEEDIVLIGPSMIGLVERAATRVEGQSAEEYLYESIVAPNAYLVPDTETNIFAAGGTSLMFQQYTDYLTEDEIDDLVAYMLSLEN